jgi:LCP family protein required for cell wall assembly
MRQDGSKQANQAQETNHLSSRQTSPPCGRSGNFLNTICMLLLLFCSVLFGIRLVSLDLLPVKYLILAAAVLLALNLVNILILLPYRKKTGGQRFCSVIALILSAIMIYGLAVTGSIQRAIKKISGSEQQIEFIDVIVLKEDSAQAVTDMRDYRFGVLAGMNDDQLSQVKVELKKDIGTVKSNAFTSASDLADALYNKKVDAVIISDALLSPLTDLEAYVDFTQKTRIVHQYKLISNTDSAESLTNVTEKPFLLYCSGTDARVNESASVCRSDVNIVAAINPKSHQILLLNTPRDYYVPLEGNTDEMDKLTHAGLYGIETSMKTLNTLYDFDLSSYVRVNFTGFEEIVNALGGISVWSDYDFTTVGMGLDDDEPSNYKSFTFQKGYNDLNGEEALGFARERYAFENGDEQRGQNQMAVIRAILNKATSPAILSKYQNVLKAVTGSVTTNIPYDVLSSLVQMQLRDNVQWNIVSYHVTGTAAYQECFSLPGTDLSVTIPDEASVNNAKMLLQQLMSGQTPDPSQFTAAQSPQTVSPS